MLEVGIWLLTTWREQRSVGCMSCHGFDTGAKLRVRFPPFRVTGFVRQGLP